jgi:hypothetical protein
MRLKVNKRIIIIIVIFACLFLPITIILAGTTGKIAGKVRDGEKGEPLPGANVIIEGTTLGAVTDVEGDYFIINVPPGTYIVKASLIGYNAIRQTDVRVNIDQTTPLNFSLMSTVIQMNDVLITAERPVIEADVASSKTVMSGDQIALLPVAQFKDVLDKMAGIREADSRGLFFRGEREYTVSLRIDGLETRDNLDNQIETRLNPDAVQEASVMTGGFNAEYGNAGGGLIDIVMKEGGSNYEGTLDGQYGFAHRKHFGKTLREYYDMKFDNMERWELLANSIDTSRNSIYPTSRSKQIYSQFIGKPKLLRELYKWRMRDEATKYGDKPDINMRGTFGGPVPFLDRTTFFLSGNYEKNFYLFNQTLPYYKNYGIVGKFTTTLIPNVKLSLTQRYVEVSGINRYDRKDVATDLTMSDDPQTTRENRYLFENVEDVAWTAAGEANHLTHWPYLDRMSIANRFKNQLALKVSYTLNPKTFMEFTVTHSNYRALSSPPTLRDTTAVITLSDDDGNTAILTGEYALAPMGYWYNVGLIDPPLAMGQANILGGSHSAYEENQDKSFMIKTTITSQVNKSNLISGGFDFTYTDLLKNERREGSDNARYQWYWHVYPKTIAFWIYDKIEFEGMIANLNLRIDGRIPHNDWMNLFNPSTRWDYHWSYDFRAGYLGPDSISGGPRYKPPNVWAVSPRLSISHPIGTHAKIFFNYSHQNQNPPYEYQYRIEKRSDKGGWDVFGNPELPYIKTIQYEIGYEQSIENVVFTAISGYYRDISNKLEEIQYNDYNDVRTLRHLRPSGSGTYQVAYRSYVPDGFSTARGIELRLESRASKYWTLWFNYDYEIFSSGVKGYSIIFENPLESPEERDYLRINPTPMPKFDVGLNLSIPTNFGPALGSFYPFADLRLSILYWWRAQPSHTILIACNRPTRRMIINVGNHIMLSISR